MASSQAAQPPLPATKPFVVKTTPFAQDSEPSSFSHKMILVVPEVKPRAITAMSEQDSPPAQDMDFADILSSAVMDKTTGYILPPPLPEWKKLAANPSVPSTDSTQNIVYADNGIPLPNRKPMLGTGNRPIDTNRYVSISEMAANKAREQQMAAMPRHAPVIEDVQPQQRQAGRVPNAPPPSVYPHFSEDRMASAPQRQATIERRYAGTIGKLREGNAPSPFASKRVQKAAKNSGGEPVILFFQEGSPDLEVGQIDVLKEDVVEALKHQPNRQAVIYGFAAPDNADPENARRLAMSRALMVREYIIGRRIDSHRVDIQASLNDDNMLPNDRVDIVIR